MEQDAKEIEYIGSCRATQNGKRASRKVIEYFQVSELCPTCHQLELRLYKISVSFSHFSFP